MEPLETRIPVAEMQDALASVQIGLSSLLIILWRRKPRA